MKNRTLQFLYTLVASVAAIALFIAPKAGVTNGFYADVALNRKAEQLLLTSFRHESTFMEALVSKNDWVNNDIIDLTEIGADPAVLIDNNTYPIAVAARVDDSAPVKLKKFETENTKVTDDELYALPYDKIGSVQQQHRLTLEETTMTYGLHSLAPLANTAETPVISTTGSDDGTGRKRMKAADIIAMKTKLDLLKVPKNGRVLVLSAIHASDLLVDDLNFNTRYQNTTTGVIAQNYYGFRVYESTYNPVWNAGSKVAYGAAPAGGDKNGSVVFYAPHAIKATGSVKRYMREAATDPENRQSVIGFSLYHIVLPMRKLGTGAIIDGTV